MTRTVLKPYDKDQVIAMVEKLISHTTRNSSNKHERKYVIFDLKNGISVKLYIDEILFIEVRLRNCIIHTPKKAYTVNKLSLKEVLEFMDCEDIIQCHKSFVVNVKYIREIEKIDGKVSQIHFESYDERIPLGYKFKSIVMDKFK
ncbi:LytR/AlgR family response regulator transcription factor [Clostridium sp. ZS2-4]|uniref:LytR/AlgR family response regulator transcription factor n=1 Tax=Clostridium sp. ZS2-4 TaxID=2987703 RepID=UPI00227D1F14|nr:LytTR family DNA-binding domain-containing protein [Clostridium sp. ZS2-4]MCY6355219.1 LytTR family DNA-binding domain-containing protein [Clostridium sp. ZS2-4]